MMFLKVLGVLLVLLLTLLGSVDAPTSQIDLAWGFGEWRLGAEPTPKVRQGLIKSDNPQFETGFGVENISDHGEFFQTEVRYEISASSMPAEMMCFYHEDRLEVIQLVFVSNFPQDFATLRVQLIEQYGSLDGVIVDRNYDYKLYGDGSVEAQWRAKRPTQDMAVALVRIVGPDQKARLVLQFTGGSAFRRMILEEPNNTSLT